MDLDGPAMKAMLCLIYPFHFLCHATKHVLIGLCLLPVAVLALAVTAVVLVADAVVTASDLLRGKK